MRSAHFLIFAVLACLALSAWSQDYPLKPIRVIVSFPPGGGADMAARTVGQKLTERWGGQPVIVDNRGGANGNIGAEAAARSTPDGYTLLVSAAPTIAINVTLYSKIPFDPVKDFAPVALLASTSYLLVAHPSLPAKSMRELIGLAKTRPGKLVFATTGVGSVPHLSTEMLKTMANIDVTHVPYKGAGPALTDLLGGHVDVIVLRHDRGGTARRFG